MYNDLNDFQLFQLAETARLAARHEYISVDQVFPRISNWLTHIVSRIKGELGEPNLLPVYCFEYAPDC